jgi:hypothetical protein
MPDHLLRPDHFSGCEGDGDAELALERAWLASSIRAFIDPLSSEPLPKRQPQYRLATCWLLFMINTVQKQKTTQGLETFSSAETVDAIRALAPKYKLTPEYMDSLIERCRSNRFPWQWCGLPLDQCSIGPCGVGFCKRVLRLLVEPIYDPAHRVSNDVLMGAKTSGNFWLFLIMKMMYGLNTACWSTRKWHTEALDFMKGNMKKFAPEIAAFWNHLKPGIARDLKSQGKRHDDKFFDDLLENIIADVFECRGPRMAICQWASWSVCTEYWDPRWNRRTFCLFLWCLSKGLITGRGAATAMELKALTPAVESAAHAARAKDVKQKTEECLRNAGKNAVHSVMRIYLEGWPLQRRIRGLELVASPLIRSYRALRRDAQSHDGMLQFYSNMVRKESLGRVCDIFGTLQTKTGLTHLGFIVDEAELPLVGLAPQVLQRLIEDEQTFAEWLLEFTFCLAGQRLYSVLYYLEGLPGVLPALLGFDATEDNRKRDLFSI